MLRSYGSYASHTSYRTNCPRIEIRNASNEFEFPKQKIANNSGKFEEK